MPLPPPHQKTEDFCCAENRFDIKTNHQQALVPTGRNPGAKKKAKMNIIKNLTKEDAFAKFTGDGDQAFPTSRLLPAHQADMQEWAEHGHIDGTPVTIYWIFENHEAEKEDGADIPFDAEHIDRIEERE